MLTDARGKGNATHFSGTRKVEDFTISGWDGREKNQPREGVRGRGHVTPF